LLPARLRDHERAPRLVDDIRRPKLQDESIRTTTLVAFMCREQNGVFFDSTTRDENADED
jgi:hypothetical protein